MALDSPLDLPIQWYQLWWTQKEVQAQYKYSRQCEHGQQKQQRKYTNVSLGLSSLSTGVVFSFQSSMMFIDKQLWMQKADQPVQPQSTLYFESMLALPGL